MTQQPDRTCTKCHKTKPWSYFVSPARPNTPRNECSPCRAMKQMISRGTYTGQPTTTALQLVARDRPTHVVVDNFRAEHVGKANREKRFYAQLNGPGGEAPQYLHEFGIVTTKDVRYAWSGTEQQFAKLCKKMGHRPTSYQLVKTSLLTFHKLSTLPE